jgi:hypothetical protein
MKRRIKRKRLGIRRPDRSLKRKGKLNQRFIMLYAKAHIIVVKRNIVRRSLTQQIRLRFRELFI